MMLATEGPITATKALSDMFFDEEKATKFKLLQNKPFHVKLKPKEESLKSSKVLSLLTSRRVYSTTTYPKKYNVNLVEELYANLDEDIMNLSSSFFYSTYVRGEIIDFSPGDLADYTGLDHMMIYSRMVLMAS